MYVFKEELAYGLGDYNRYIYPYYAGWLVFAVTMPVSYTHLDVYKRQAFRREGNAVRPAAAPPRG